MTVYVDNYNAPAAVTNSFNGRVHRSRWSHMTADTPDELRAFAARIGMRREWFQTCKRACGKGPCVHWHYDLTAPRRAKAVAVGAVEIDIREMGALCSARRKAQQAATS